jgi:D-beta-D-heptose 7-phosphate kinase/D-beta-D-heptose 1-phosphate adenosyltransferase
VNAEERILPLDALLVRLKAERAAGRKVVFTNGCFDLLHAGHAFLLERAAALGEILVVGLNTDASVRRLKGPERPVVPQGERAALLASLRAVDYVVLFEEETPLELITALQPDILVKGEDYPMDRIVGRGIVESRGGQVVRLPLLPGRSSSGLLARLRNGR